MTQVITNTKVYYVYVYFIISTATIELVEESNKTKNKTLLFKIQDLPLTKWYVGSTCLRPSKFQDE